MNTSNAAPNIIPNTTSVSAAPKIFPIIIDLSIFIALPSSLLRY